MSNIKFKTLTRPMKRFLQKSNYDTMKWGYKKNSTEEFIIVNKEDGTEVTFDKTTHPFIHNYI